MRHNTPVIVCFLALLLLATSATAQEDLWPRYNSGDRLGALERALELLEDDPDNIDLQHMAGRVLAEQGRNDEARPYLENCIAADERDWRWAWSLFYLGGIEATESEDDAAREHWMLARDARITRNVSQLAEANLRSFGLSEDFQDWTRRRSDHLNVAFSPAHADKDMDRWMLGHEKAFERLTGIFGAAPEFPVRYIVWKDIPEATQICGIEMLGFAQPRYNIVHCLWEQSVAHEMAHVFTFHALHPVAETRFINEGVAIAHDLTRRDRMATARAAMDELDLDTVDVRLMWEGEHPGGDELLYPVAGAWVDFLIEREGRAKLLELARNQTLENAALVYGDDFDGLVAEFEGALND